MAYIQERRAADGSISYRVRFRPDGKLVSETFADEKDAVKFKALVDGYSQKYPPGWVAGAGFIDNDDAAVTPTLREWAARSIAARSTANDRTRHDYEQAIATHVPDDVLDTPLHEITRERMGQLILDVSKRRKHKTVKNLHGLLSSIFNDAVDDGVIGRNPMRKLMQRVQSDVRDESVFLTPAEFELLRDSMVEHYQDILTFFVRTGCRFSEVSALSKAQVDFMTRTVRIDRAIKRDADSTFYVGSPKSRKSRRSITFDDTLAEILERLCADKSQDDFVFTTAEGSRVHHSNFTQRFWYPALHRAMTCELHRDSKQPCGCANTLTKRPTVHDLRHTHASWLIAAGVPLPAIQARLGHESITTTIDLYGHLMPDADRNAVDSLTRLLAAH